MPYTKPGRHFIQAKKPIPSTNMPLVTIFAPVLNDYICINGDKDYYIRKGGFLHCFGPGWTAYPPEARGILRLYPLLPCSACSEDENLNEPNAISCPTL